MIYPQYHFQISIGILYQSGFGGEEPDQKIRRSFSRAETKPTHFLGIKKMRRSQRKIVVWWFKCELQLGERSADKWSEKKALRAMWIESSSHTFLSFVVASTNPKTIKEQTQLFSFCNRSQWLIQKLHKYAKIWFLFWKNNPFQYHAFQVT